VSYVVKSGIADPAARSFTFVAQTTLYGGVSPCVLLT